MFGFMMLVYLAWARSDRPGVRNGGWLETVRTANFDALVGRPGQASAGQPTHTAQPAQTAQAGRAAGAAGAGQAVAGTGAPQGGQGGQGGPGGQALAAARGNIDDDEHLDAYNAYLARLNQAERRPGQ